MRFLVDEILKNCILQISLSARIEKRDVTDAPVTTSTETSFFQSIKTGLENTFTKERFDVSYCAVDLVTCLFE